MEEDKCFRFLSKDDRCQLPAPILYSPFENGSESVADWLTLVGTTEDFLTKVGSVPDVNFLSAAQNTSRKYYLKINGKEV